MSKLINDDQLLVSAKRGNYDIPIYDDGFGKLYIHRDSIGISGIVRAQTWEDAYSICEDEFFPEADETIEEMIKEYGFKVEYLKIIKSDVSIPEDERPPYLGAYQKVAEISDYSGNGRLPEHLFIRWHRLETPDPDTWSENDCWNEAFGFRPNGPNVRDKIGHGIYSKDLNGDSLDVLTPELLKELDIELTVKDWE